LGPNPDHIYKLFLADKNNAVKIIIKFELLNGILKSENYMHDEATSWHGNCIYLCQQLTSSEESE